MFLLLISSRIAISLFSFNKILLFIKKLAFDGFYPPLVVRLIEMVHKKWLNVYQIASKIVPIEGRRCEFINGTRALDEFDVLPPWRRTKAMENHYEKWRAIDEVPYKFSKNYMRQLKTDYKTNFRKLAMRSIK